MKYSKRQILKGLSWPHLGLRSHRRSLHTARLDPQEEENLATTYNARHWNSG